MANMRRYLDQPLKPAEYNPANYAGMSLEDLENHFKAMAQAKGSSAEHSPESIALYVFLDCFPEPLEGLEVGLDPLAGIDPRADLQRDIEALDPWQGIEDIEVIEPWEALEDIEDLLRT